MTKPKIKKDDWIHFIHDVEGAPNLYSLDYDSKGKIFNRLSDEYVQKKFCPVHLNYSYRVRSVETINGTIYYELWIECDFDHQYYVYAGDDDYRSKLHRIVYVFDRDVKADKERGETK